MLDKKTIHLLKETIEKVVKTENNVGEIMLEELLLHDCGPYGRGQLAPRGFGGWPASEWVRGLGLVHVLFLLH